MIGHLKSDHRLDRCFLRGRIGDKLNLIGSAAGFNVRKLLGLLGLGIFFRALSVWGVMGWFLLFCRDRWVLLFRRFSCCVDFLPCRCDENDFFRDDYSTISQLNFYTPVCEYSQVPLTDSAKSYKKIDKDDK